MRKLDVVTEIDYYSQEPSRHVGWTHAVEVDNLFGNLLCEMLTVVCSQVIATEVSHRIKRDVVDLLMLY